MGMKWLDEAGLVAIGQCLETLLVILGLLAGMKVVFSRHPMKGVLALMGCFLVNAALWILCGAEFLGISLVIVYGGAVMVLFLFVVMMLPLKKVASTLRLHRLWFIGFGAVFALGASLAWIFNRLESAVQMPNSEQGGMPSYHLFEVLYERFGYAVLLAAILLLLALLAAIQLARDEVPRFRKKQRVDEQVQVDKAERLECVETMERDTLYIARKGD